MVEQDKPNTFAKHEADQPETQNTAAPTTQGEVDIASLSDTAVGERVKYNRPILDGKEDVIKQFQIFPADTSKDPQSAMSGSSKYWPVSMILTYESTNEDGVHNREYVPGARVFQNSNGEAGNINFWYDGGNTQCCKLWELVAKKIGINPDELSPRQFAAFLNNKPKVKIVGDKVQNPQARTPAEKWVTKNMPGEFL